MGKRLRLYFAGSCWWSSRFDVWASSAEVWRSSGKLKNCFQFVRYQKIFSSAVCVFMIAISNLGA